MMTTQLARQLASNAIGGCAVNGAISAQGLANAVSDQAASWGWSVPAVVPPAVAERAADRRYDTLAAWILEHAC